MHLFFLLFPFVLFLEMVSAFQTVVFVTFLEGFGRLLLGEELVELLLEEIVYLEQFGVVVLELLEVGANFGDYVVEGVFSGGLEGLFFQKG